MTQTWFTAYPVVVVAFAFAVVLVMIWRYHPRVQGLIVEIKNLREQLEREQDLLDRSDLEVERLKAELNKRESLETARAALESQFRALAGDALKQNSESFLKLAEENLGKFQTGARADLELKQKAVEEIVKPMRESLEKFQFQVQELEKSRTAAYSSLTEHVTRVTSDQESLRQETQKLVRALRMPTVRGRWGEIQLKRVVEIAGMTSYCDFSEQYSVDTGEGRLQPDMIVRLPGGKTVVIDAKAPLAAYLDSLEAGDEESRALKLGEHAGQIQTHMRKLSAKAYWDQFDATPEFVIMFLPGEMFFSAALEQKPELIEEGVGQRVILATPTTLIALLRAVAYGWRQERIAETAEEVSKLASDLYNRLGILVDHFAKLGTSLERSVKAYNDTIGSLERNVLSAARRFPELGVSIKKALPDLEPIKSSTRDIAAKELKALAERSD